MRKEAVALESECTSKRKTLDKAEKALDDAENALDDANEAARKADNVMKEALEQVNKCKQEETRSRHKYKKKMNDLNLLTSLQSFKFEDDKCHICWVRT